MPPSGVADKVLVIKLGLKSVNEQNMAKKSLTQPTKRKDAEIIVKRSFGLSSMFSDGDPNLHSYWYTGVALFANRRGYRFLADFFRWMAERPISESEGDPGDNVHLTPKSELCDEIDFTFDTLTPHNRNIVLQNANTTKISKRRGTPIRQFSNLVSEMMSHFNGFLLNDEVFRHSTVDEINELIAVLEKERSRLEAM